MLASHLHALSVVCWNDVILHPLITSHN
jgi:hypothetical protein